MSILAQAVRLIIKQRPRVINCCNMEGLTALDIALGHPNSIAEALRSAGAERSSSSHSRTQNLADYCALILERSLLGMLYRKDFIKVKTPNPGTASIITMSAEMRSSLLVVFVLIATATYQAILSPPGGLISGGIDVSRTSNSTNEGHGTSNSTSAGNGTSSSTNAGHKDLEAAPTPPRIFPPFLESRNLNAGGSQTWLVPFYTFLVFNSVLFMTSLFTMYYLLQANDKSDSFLTTSLVYFAGCYIISVIIITPRLSVGLGFVIGLVLIVVGICSMRLLLPQQIMRNAFLSETESTTSKRNQ